MAAELKAQRRLKEVLFEAQETTKDEQEELDQQFLKQGLSEDQTERQAW
jgi:hypothetical protein